MTIRALALDLSLAATGLARTHASTGEPRLSCTTLTVPRNSTRPTLMDHRRVHGVFGEVARAAKAGLDLAVIEWLPQIEGHGDASLRLAELGGVIRHWLWGRGVAYVEVRPQHLKMFATGNGGASKEDVCAAVVARYGRLLAINPRDDNQCDAVTLLAMGLHAMGEPLADVPETHRRALDSYSGAWPSIALGGVR